MTKTRLQTMIEWVGTTQSLIIHSIFFIFMLSLPALFGVDASLSLLILTTLVSLEAIYLNIFIQMGVNRHADEQAKTNVVLSSVQETVEDVQETIEDVQETVEDVQETIDEEEEKPEGR